MNKIAASFICVLVLAGPALGQPWSFVDVTTQAGFDYQHKYSIGGDLPSRAIFGGVAAGDYDRDGWVDLFVVQGNVASDLLFRNLGDGTFEEVSMEAGVDTWGELGSGPAFADLDGDGWLDLVIGGIESTQPRLFRNEQDGTFSDVSTGSGLSISGNAFSVTCGDYDRDDDLDLLFGRWGSDIEAGHLFRNDGAFTFFEADKTADLVVAGDSTINLVYSFTGNFADINDDGWPDVVLACDFSTSQIHLNDGDGTFTNVTAPVISDENGMGAAVGDIDRDGDLDWFVSSVSPQPAPASGPPHDPLETPLGRAGDDLSTSPAATGDSGNRMYRNEGGGVFADITDSAGVRDGHWGWGSGFADFNNDGALDLFHVNGWSSGNYAVDPARLFVGDGAGGFSEEALLRGVADTGQGRGIVCFDYDRDGDLDIFIANNKQAPVLYRNDGGNALNFLEVRLQGPPPNTEGIGARVRVTAGSSTQLWEIRSGCNFVSQDPAVAHFGLGGATMADEVRVDWPGGAVTIVKDVLAGARLVLTPDAAGVVDGRATEKGLRFLGVSPNPMCANTTIVFELEHPANIVLRLFNARGRLIRTLTEGIVPAGAWNVGWNSRDSRGSPVSPGVYFIRLDATASSSTEKIVVLK